MSERLVSVDELATVDDIARELHINLSVMMNIVKGRDGRAKAKFPQPVVGRGIRAVWLWDDVADWSSRAELHTSKKAPVKRQPWAQGRRAA